ncbi:hypothetical protein C8R45DRAFT_381826 [Mycena sanguinolenta]|nr:hypothetical protein C8R45DRAFT_381826 [Mycena sanguinolenta]
MSTNPETFPRRRPFDHPPPRCGELVNGRPTPTYALAWVCPARTFYKNLGGGELGKVDDCNFTDVVSKKWRACPKFEPGLKPIPYPGVDGNFYLIAMFNERDADHLNRVLDVAGDPLIQSARICMGVDLDPTLEDTLQWIRFPS